MIQNDKAMTPTHQAATSARVPARRSSAATPPASSATTADPESAEPGHDLAPCSRADLDAVGADHHTALLDRVPRRYVISGGRVVAQTRTNTELHVP